MPESAWRAVLSEPVSSHIDFAGSPRPTLGVEWEFALVDAETRDVSNVATEVIEELGENNPRVHKELLRNTVEIVTGICDSVPEAMDDLRSTLGAAHAIVRGRGMELFCAGTHPFAKWSPEILTDAPRYAELIKRTQWWGRQMLIWGVHGAQGDGHQHVVAQPLPAPSGALCVLAILGRRGHRIRLQPRNDVPAAADGRAAVPLLHVGGMGRLRL
jgi:carboxylate-amine ligase